MAPKMRMQTIMAMMMIMPTQLPTYGANSDGNYTPAEQIWPSTMTPMLMPTMVPMIMQHDEEANEDAI